MFECEWDELEAHNGDVYRNDTESPITSLAEVAAWAHMRADGAPVGVGTTTAQPT